MDSINSCDLYVLFNEINSKNEEEGLDLNSVGLTLINEFEIVAFILRWITMLRKEKILDKELQE